MKRLAGIIVFIVLSVNMFGGNEVLEKRLKYRETTKGKKEFYTLEIYEEEIGKRIHGKFEDKTLDVWQNDKEEAVGYRVEKSGNILKYLKKEDKIVSGKFEKELEGLSWYQLGNIRKSFITGKDRSKHFVFLSENFDERLSGKEGMALMEMVLYKQKEEILLINGEEVKTIKVRLTFPDMRSIFWRAHYWYRKSDGVMLRAEMRRGAPGTPKTVVELIEEV